jgi:uncharacterized protein
MATFQLHSSHAPYATQLLCDEHHVQVLTFLSADVVSNLFQLCWLENHGVCADERPELYHYAGAFGRGGSLQAVALVITDRLLLIDARDADAAFALGRWYRQRGLVLEHVVSAKASVEPLWRAYSTHPQHDPVGARLLRDQELYVLERERWSDADQIELRGQYQPTEVRRAGLDELEPVFFASARMHLEETLEDPLETQPKTFRRHVRHRIRSGRTFAWFDEHRRLCFKADISALSSFGAQISGVYTPPRYRGQGIATRALFDICEELFESGLPRVTLYVNAHNDAARHVYQKVGFQFHADYQTVFVETAHQP